MNRPINILVANGVNLDLLGRRETQWYGQFTLQDLERSLNDAAKEFGNKVPKGLSLLFFQSNDERSFIERFDRNDFDGALINAGAWTHTSLALHDRLAALKIIFSEVHISKLSERESFRQHSYLTPLAVARVDGLGIKSYTEGLRQLLDHFAAKT